MEYMRRIFSSIGSTVRCGAVTIRIAEHRPVNTFSVYKIVSESWWPVKFDIGTAEKRHVWLCPKITGRAWLCPHSISIYTITILILFGGRIQPRYCTLNAKARTQKKKKTENRTTSEKMEPNVTYRGFR